MNANDKAQPVGDKHIAFARALIALCRQHGANNIEVEFSLTGKKMWPPSKNEEWSDARVMFTWAEGRHADQSRALLRAETSISIEEKPECPQSPDGRHHVDTSMEAGPNHCFHCEQPMRKRGTTHA